MNLKETTPQKNPDNHVDCQPNPARFAIYNILPGEFGFTIPNCDFVFEFDRHGGWFDEYGNYYNAQGESAEVPIEYEEDLQGDPQIGYYEEEVNRYADNDNDGKIEKEDEPLEFFDNKHLNRDNQKVLEKYTNSKEISVELHNLSSHWNEDDFEKFLVDNKIEWIIFQFEYDYQQQFSGLCYITLDKENTLKLLELNGYKILGKNLNMLVIEPQKVKKNDENLELINGNDSNTLKKPFEEAKTLENDRDEPTYKRPYPDGKPSSSEKSERKGLGNGDKTVEHVSLPSNVDSKVSKKGD